MIQLRVNTRILMVNIYRLNQAQRRTAIGLCERQRKSEMFRPILFEFHCHFSHHFKCYWLENRWNIDFPFFSYSFLLFFFFFSNGFRCVRCMYFDCAKLHNVLRMIAKACECIVSECVCVCVCVVNILCAINPLFTLINRQRSDIGCEREIERNRDRANEKSRVKKIM